jgi:hypothetical protein
MINRIKLQDGKLYESVNGERFRVKWDQKLSRFVCPQSSYVRWDYDRFPSDGNLGSALVREIPELRWVSINEEDVTNGMVVTKKRGHWYRQVTRDEAQRLAPNYKQQEQVLTNREQLGAKIESVRQGDKDFLRITTPSGKVVIVEV